MIGYVYKHTNKENGKVYIGQTTQSPQSRWNEGKGYKGQRAFYRDILKYGWDNFDHDIIMTISGPTEKILKKSLKQLESQYILEYKSMLPDKGYNTFVASDVYNTFLSVPAKRVVRYLMEQGKTFDEAYEEYKKTKSKR